MATQLVQLPPYLLQALLDADIGGKWFPGNAGKPGIAFAKTNTTKPDVAILVIVWDPRLSWDAWPLQGASVLTLLLCSPGYVDRTFLPRSLPDDLLQPVFDALVAAISGCLGGHDALELFTVVDVARRQPNLLPLPPQCRRPRNRPERRLLQSARLLQQRFAPAFGDLHVDIKSYGEVLLRSGLGPYIGSLVTEGAVADSLSLAPTAIEGCLTLYHDDTETVDDLLVEVGLARSVRFMTKWALGQVAPYNRTGRCDFSVYHVAQIYGRSFADFGAGTDHLWRREDPRHTEFPISVPAIGVPRAMVEFIHAFDLHLMADVDPLIKAVLAWWQLLRIQPFGRFDRQMAEIVLHILLRQAGVPPLPLPMVMHRRYWENAHMLQIALEQDQCDCLVATMIARVREALKLGRDMMDQLGAERRQLIAALAETDVPLPDAESAVSELMGNVLVSRTGVRDLGEGARRNYALERLHSMGLIDRISANDEVWWSSAAVRSVASYDPRGNSCYPAIGEAGCTRKSRAP